MFTLLFRLSIHLLGLTTFFDLPFDDSLADPQVEMIDCRRFGQGKDIDAFRPFFAGVREFLFNDGARDHSGHCDLHVGIEGGGRDESTGLTGAKEQAALRHVTEADRFFDRGWFLSAGMEDRGSPNPGIEDTQQRHPEGACAGSVAGEPGGHRCLMIWDEW